MVFQEFVSKEAVLRSLQEMPERIPIDDLFNRLVYLCKIEIGLAQSERGEGTTLEEIKEKAKSWGREK